MIPLILILALISASGFVYYFGWLSGQIQYVILADGRRQARSLPIVIRAVLPLAAFTPNALRKGVAKRYCEEVDRKLLTAGYEELLTGRELVLTQWWLLVLSLGVGLLV